MIHIPWIHILLGIFFIYNFTCESNFSHSSFYAALCHSLHFKFITLNPIYFVCIQFPIWLINFLVKATYFPCALIITSITIPYIHFTCGNRNQQQIFHSPPSINLHSVHFNVIRCISNFLQASFICCIHFPTFSIEI